MKKNCGVVALILCVFCLQAQETGIEVSRSPEAYSLGRYGEVPVGTYTGKPEISIPIYNIKVRDFTLPISLTYDATGIRVDQEATWVGLGWNLMAGGVIIHTINGSDDQKSNTYSVTGYLGNNWLKIIDSGEIFDQNLFDVSPSENASLYWTKHRIENYPIDWGCTPLNSVTGGDGDDDQDNLVFREAA